VGTPLQHPELSGLEVMLYTPGIGPIIDERDVSRCISRDEERGRDEDARDADQAHAILSAVGI
jgi:hypothetical protein